MRNNKFKSVTAVLLIILLISVIFTAFGCKPEDDAQTQDQNGETDMNPTATIIIKDQNGIDRKIVIELYKDKAPITVNNFITLANKGIYNGTIFHRIVPDGCLQGGGYKLVNDSITEIGEDVTPIYGEFKSNGWANNDIKHEKGVISMARTSVKDSATSQFFICVDSYPSWDGEYAAFGKAVDEESLNNLTELGKSTYGMINAYFQTFPYPILTLVSVTINA